MFRGGACVLRCMCVQWQRGQFHLCPKDYLENVSLLSSRGIDASYSSASGGWKQVYIQPLRMLPFLQRTEHNSGPTCISLASAMVRSSKNAKNCQCQRRARCRRLQRVAIPLSVSVCPEVHHRKRHRQCCFRSISGWKRRAIKRILVIMLHACFKERPGTIFIRLGIISKVVALRRLNRE